METFELKNIITHKKKKSMERFKRSLEKTEARIGELNDKTVDITQYEQTRENRVRTKI